MRALVLALALALLVPAAAGAVPGIDAVGALDPEPGKPARVVVHASDPSGEIVASVRVDRAGGGSFAESACGVSRDGRFRPPGGTFEVPVSEDGAGDVAITVGTGSCAPGAPPAQQSEPQAFDLRLLPPLPGLPPLPRLPVARAAQAQASCPDAALQVAAATVRRVRRAIVCLVNAARRAAGVRPVKPHRRLQRAGSAHAKDMRARSYFAHEHPDGPDLVTRLKRARFWPATAGENLGASTGALATASAIVDAWMHSAGHRANMLDGRFRWIGVGIQPAFPAPPSAPGATVAAEFGAR